MLFNDINEITDEVDTFLFEGMFTK